MIRSAAYSLLAVFILSGCAVQNPGGGWGQSSPPGGGFGGGGLMGSLMAAQAAQNQAMGTGGASGGFRPAQQQGGVSAAAIHDAAAAGNVNQLTYLLDSGGSVEARLSGGITPLMTAAKADQIECVRLLIQRGARTDAVSDGGWTPLMFAESFQASENVKTALRVGKPKPLAAPPADASQPAPAVAAVPASDVDKPRERAEPRDDDYALVIGIEKYSRLPDARYAERDADAVKKHLLALGYPERNIVLLKGGQATRGAVQGYVEEWLPKNVKADSELFVYFSGHGSPDPKNGDAYIVPWDGDAMFLKSTAYPLKSLYSSLGKLKAKRVLVALDSCFSGAGGRSVLADGARPLVSHVDSTETPDGVTVLSAASGDEITATIDEQGHGAFTYYLLKALNDGKLTVQGAYDELKPRVEDEAHRQNREQTPLMLGDDASF